MPNNIIVLHPERNDDVILLNESFIDQINNYLAQLEQIPNNNWIRLKRGLVKLEADMAIKLIRKLSVEIWKAERKNSR